MATAISCGISTNNEREEVEHGHLGRPAPTFSVRTAGKGRNVSLVKILPPLPQQRYTIGDGSRD